VYIEISPEESNELYKDCVESCFISGGAIKTADNIGEREILSKIIPKKISFKSRHKKPSYFQRDLEFFFRPRI